MTAYCDTSFVVSLYTPDANSALAVRECRRSRAGLLVTPLTGLEFTNALRLRLFRGEVTLTEAEASAAAFETDLANGIFTIHPLAAAVFEKGRQLSRLHTSRLGVRCLDILHVAAALVARAAIIYSFDGPQRRLARVAGLRVAPRLAAQR